MTYPILKLNPSIPIINIFLIEFIFSIFKTKLVGLNIVSNYELVLESYYLHVNNMVLVLIKHTALRFNKLSDIVIYDRPEYKLRFVLSYIISNADRELRARIRFSAQSKYTIVPSIATIMYSAS